MQTKTKIPKKPESIYTRGVCVVCNKNTQKYKGSVNGKRTYMASCTSCHSKRYNINRVDSRYKYRIYKKNYCESCGFIPEHKCQLDVDHIDGNHKNDNLDNLQTLCANCHRLKTYKQLHT